MLSIVSHDQVKIVHGVDSGHPRHAGINVVTTSDLLTLLTSLTKSGKYYCAPRVNVTMFSRPQSSPRYDQKKMSGFATPYPTYRLSILYQPSYHSPPYQIENVIDLLGERMDVFPVDLGNECFVQLLHNLVGKHVAGLSNS